MNTEQFEIVIIDVNPKEHIKDNLRLEFPNATIEEYTSAKKGAEYIFQNLDKKRIVFLDYKFGANDWQGLDVLKKIRNKTSLLYIILMTAEIVNIKREELIELISDDGVSLISCDEDYEVYIKLVEKYLSFMDAKLDCVLEQWIINHPSDKDKTYIIEGNKHYSLNDILCEIRNQTSFGKEVEKKMLSLTVHLLTQSKEDIQ